MRSASNGSCAMKPGFTSRRPRRRPRGHQPRRRELTQTLLRRRNGAAKGDLHGVAQGIVLA